MKSEVVSGRYAQALFAWAEDQSLSDSVRVAIGMYQQYRFPSFCCLLKNPVVPLQKKIEWVERMFEGERLLPPFIRMLIRKGRVEYLDEIFRLYVALYLAKQNVLSGKLRVAYPLEVELFVRLQKKLEKEVGQKMVLTVIHDPTLLGGFVFSTDTLLLDASLLGQLCAIAKRWTRLGAVSP